jgi:protein TonB
VARLQSGRKPDVAPVVLNAELPFRYPAALWKRKVQGNVTLRLFVDTVGQPAHDSTIVFASSGVPALDSAAVTGARNLHFRPATLAGKPVSVTVLLPVFFRHPDARPLPGDSLLKQATPAPRRE